MCTYTKLVLTSSHLNGSIIPRKATFLFPTHIATYISLAVTHEDDGRARLRSNDTKESRQRAPIIACTEDQGPVIVLNIARKLPQ